MVTDLRGEILFMGGSVPHYMPCLRHTAYNCLLPQLGHQERKSFVPRKFMKLIIQRLVRLNKQSLSDLKTHLGTQEALRYNVLITV